GHASATSPECDLQRAGGGVDLKGIAFAAAWLGTDSAVVRQATRRRCRIRGRARAAPARARRRTVRRASPRSGPDAFGPGPSAGGDTAARRLATIVTLTAVGAVRRPRRRAVEAATHVS